MRQPSQCLSFDQSNLCVVGVFKASVKTDDTINTISYQAAYLQYL